MDKRVTVREDGRHVYRLRKPVAGAHGPVEELAFRPEATTADMMTLKVGQALTVADIAEVGGKLCGQPPLVMQKLSSHDVAVVSDLVMGFLFSGPETGPTSSDS